MQIHNIEDMPSDTDIILIIGKADFKFIKGKGKSLKIAFASHYAKDEQTLLSFLPYIDVLYLNIREIKTPELKNLILRLNPEILL